MNQGSTSWADYPMDIRILFATVSCLCRATNDDQFDLLIASQFWNPKNHTLCRLMCIISWVSHWRHSSLPIVPAVLERENAETLYRAIQEKHPVPFFRLLADIEFDSVQQILIQHSIMFLFLNFESTYTSIVHCTMYINHINYMTWLYGLLFRSVTVANWGWADAASIYLLRLVSDKGSANLKMIRQGILKDRPANCIVFSKTCDQ